MRQTFERVPVDISVVIPVYNEEGALPAVYRALADALDRLPQSAEIVFADDGSIDGSADRLDAIAATDPRVRVLHMSRNYGQTAALMAAIQNSSGDVVIPMDGDGQNDPADIPLLLAKLAEGFDVVSGWRVEREDNALSRRLPSIVANWLISALLHVPLHDYGCTLKAYRREVLEDVRLYGEMHRFIPIYAAWEGGRVAEIAVSHHPRRFGKSKYGIGRIARVLLDLLIVYFIDRAFDRPIQFFGKLGLGFLVLSVAVFGWALVLKYAWDVSLIQTPLTLLAAVIGLSGVLFLLLGIIAEVQARIYYEARGRPPYKIRRIVQHPASPQLRSAPVGANPLAL
jgi:glycosyltransferase involved in cell wall biosynthesis